MMAQINLKFKSSLLSALILSFCSQVSVFAENDSFPDITEIERLKIDSDPTLMTKFTTEWETDQAPLDAYENGHALLFHDGYIYTYLDRYGDEPLLRKYNSANPDDCVEKELPFNDLGILNAGSLPRHAVSIDADGNIIFIFGLQNTNQSQLLIVVYDFASNSITASQRINLNEKTNLNETNLSFAKVKLNGTVDGALTLTTYITTKDNSYCYIRPLTITGNKGAFSADLGSYVYRFNTSNVTIADICELDDEHILLSDDEEGNPITLLTYRSGDFEFTEDWTDEKLLPQISTASDPNAFGMYPVKHNGHKFLIYAYSYVGDVAFNVVKWEDFSSFSDMKPIGRINIGSSANVTQIYNGGFRQIVIEGEQSPAPSRDNNYYNESAFFTYAPGVKLAKHKIITETDLIYTAISTAEESAPLRVEGHKLSNPNCETVRIFDATGKLRKVSNATIITFDNLPQGFYLIETSNEAIKMIL